MINAIIVAAGSGSRMGKSIKKQYMHLNDLPILCHVLKTFAGCNSIDKIYLAVPKYDVKMCQVKYVEPLRLSHKITIISGGSNRQSSVFKSLKAVEEKEGIVLIHDGSRPLVTRELILRCIEGVKKTGACIPAISSSDSIKEIKNHNFIKTILRKNIFFAQTPQTFNFNLIFNAHYWAKNKNFNAVDDSSILETLGININVIEGDKCNIKITTQQDLLIAEGIVKMINS